VITETLTETLVRTDDVVRSLLNDDHLPECPHACGRGPADCDWCRWAVATPELTTVLDVGTDVGRLLRSDVLDTVPGVVAAARLFELFAGVDLDRVDVPSARRLTAVVSDDTARRLDELEHRIRLSTRPGGPIDELCRRTAGALAVASMQAGDDNEMVALLPPTLRSGFDELARTVSGGVQLASLLPVVDHLHWRGMPDLATQPEWTRRPAPGEEQALRTLRLAASRVQAGSLEAFVLESVLDRCTEMLVELGGRIDEVTQPVVYRRPSTESPFDGRTRATLWRILPVDWHLTLIDSGLAACWDTELIDGVRSTVVPWVVHVAGQALRKKGFRSAIFREPAAVVRRLVSDGQIELRGSGGIGPGSHKRLVTAVAHPPTVGR